MVYFEILIYSEIIEGSWDKITLQQKMRYRYYVIATTWVLSLNDSCMGVESF